MSGGNSMSGFYLVDLSLPSADLVLGLINNDSGSALTYDSVSLGIPGINLDITHPRNTTMLLKNGKYHRDLLRVYYDRLNISDIVGSQISITLSTGLETKVSDLLDEINAEFGLGLASADIVDAPLNFTGSNVLVISPGSFAWVGEVLLTLITDGYAILVGTRDNIPLISSTGNYYVIGNNG